MKHICAFSLKETLDSANCRMSKCPYVVWAVGLRHWRAGDFSTGLGVSSLLLSLDSLGFFEQAALTILWLTCQVKVKQPWFVRALARCEPPGLLQHLVHTRPGSWSRDWLVTVQGRAGGKVSVVALALKVPSITSCQVLTKERYRRNDHYLS